MIEDKPANVAKYCCCKLVHWNVFEASSQNIVEYNRRDSWNFASFDSTKKGEKYN